MKTIKLEQNYRSTKNILSSANAVIANNPERLGKKLWSENKEGEPLKIYRAFNERDEASFIVDIIKNWIDEGRSLNDVAILYRSNAQSRVLEDSILGAELPYRIYGGVRFYESFHRTLRRHKFYKATRPPKYYPPKHGIGHLICTKLLHH